MAVRFPHDGLREGGSLASTLAQAATKNAQVNLGGSDGPGIPVIFVSHRVLGKLSKTFKAYLLFPIMMIE